MELKQIEGAVWRKNLEHEGIEIEFEGKPAQEIINELKGYRFKWSRRQGIWYSKGYDYQVEFAKKIATYGGEVGQKLTFAEKIEGKLERAENREMRFSELAEKTEEKGTAMLDQAHKMASIIPLGQPIMIGHHSEKEDRNYRNRIQTKFERGFETIDKAKYFKQRAGAAADFQDRTFNLETTLRRIKDLEASIRKQDAYELKHIQEWEGDLYRFTKKIDDKRWCLLSRKFLEGCERRKEEINEPLEYWKGIVKQHEDQGMKVWGREDFKVGDQIIACGARATVRRVNPKSLTVEYCKEKNWMNALTVTKVPYEHLGQKCKEVE